MLASVVSFATAARAVAIEMLVESDISVESHSLEVVCEEGVESFARPFAHVPDKEAAMLTVIKAVTQKTTYLEQWVDA